MPILTSPQERMIIGVNELETRLGSLAMQMKSKPNRWRADMVMKVPLRGKVEVSDDQDIAVSQVYGKEAFDLAVDGLTNTRIISGQQHPRETLRVPAAVALPDDWIAEIHATNALRREIEAAAVEIEDRKARTLAWKFSSYLSSLQITRQTWVIGAPASIKMYWNCAPSIKVLTAHEWIDGFEKQLTKLYGATYTEASLGENNTGYQYLLAMRVLQELSPQELVAQYRKGKPHIRTQLKEWDNPTLITRVTSSPLVYSIEESVPLLIPLCNWEASKPLRPSRGKVEYEPEPIVEAFNLYRYKTPKFQGA